VTHLKSRPASILLTPLRTQNVPPPLSSHQLSLDPDLSAVTSACVSRIPVHASFSSEDDHLALLWECGYIEYWNLRTRLGPGPGKVMEPVKVWSGVIDGHNRSWRQLLVRSLEEHSVIFVLGASPEADILAAIKVDKDEAENVQQRELSALQNSRLISVYPVIAVQDSKGKVHECTSPFSPHIYPTRLI
jgi:elongator complex protein 1